MPINIGTGTVGGIRVGTQEIGSVYVGRDLVWTGAAPATGRATLQPTSARIFLSNSLSSSETALASVYPFDFSTPIGSYLPAGATVNIVVMDPDGDGPITGTDEISILGVPGTGAGADAIPDAIDVDAAVGGIGGVGIRRFTMPPGEGAFNISGVTGAGGRTLVTSGAINVASFDVNVTLVGLTQFAGNSFYSAPDITRLQTTPVHAESPGTCGFYIGGVTPNQNTTYTAERGGVDITQNLFVTLTNPIPSWGLSWVGIFATMGGQFNLPGTGTINVTITQT